MHFQITITSDYVAGYGLVTFSELRDQRAKKQRKKESLVYKSADNYVWRPNKFPVIHERKRKKAITKTTRSRMQRNMVVSGSGI